MDALFLVCLGVHRGTCCRNILYPADDAADFVGVCCESEASDGDDPS